ncbi:alpha/beta fold hydrolase [Marivita sp. GX14005]|uniref:S9 family peptidase n=1 Tax=Marivita sp. GX14005 TaxID=2942276 RepID=UPI002018C44F|nr:alpha/beta fold hydrolase [Marivita sp. GX14005]MCL3883387.1 S9 family peptidase [Marivita sp. GX14005]
MPGIDEALWAQVTPYLPWSLAKTVRNRRVDPVWFQDGAAFWYRRETETLPEFICVETETGTRRTVFDSAALAKALGAVTDRPEAALDRIELLDPGAARIALDGAIYGFDGTALVLERPRRCGPDALPSPDGRRALFRRAGDLWLRDLDSGAETRLTTTGAAHFEWAKSPDQSLETLHIARRGISLPPVAVWSPDSRKVLTHQLDERRVRRLPLVQHIPDDGSLRPVLHDLRVAFTGDPDLPMIHHAVIDVLSGQISHLDVPPQHATETTTIEKLETWWSADSARLWLLDHNRFETRIALIEADATTGRTREIVAETCETFADVNMEFGRVPNIRILDRSNEAIWFSQADGWAHLYLVDLGTGKTLRQLTRGPWVVRDILAVDEAARRVLFLAGGITEGDTPYQRAVCAVSLDGGAVQVLTPERGDHDVAMRAPGWRDMVEEARRLTPQPAAVAPDGRHFVSARAPLDGLPVSELRRADGTLVAQLEEATAPPEGMILPEPFTATAADGETVIHGMIWMPEGAAEDRSIPLVEMVYPGPQCIEAPLSAFPADPSEFFKTALAGVFARLGLAAVIIDARGTPFRSKALHDACHKRLHDPGHLEDHAAALEQLCASRPALDPARIGIMGHSAGGHAAARAVLAHPEVWKAAVATAGSHDPRLYNHAWPEKWNGPLERFPDGSTSYDAAANAPLAHRLQGALFLGHGDMDDNVHPAQTQRLAAALIDAGKAFEMLITPNDDHYSFPRAPYVVRREIDFLLRHLT